jgi:hypothetical protein
VGDQIQIGNREGYMSTPSGCFDIGSGAFIWCDPSGNASSYTGVFGGFGGVDTVLNHGNGYQSNNRSWFDWLIGLNSSDTTSTYNLYEDQVTIAGRVDAGFLVNTTHYIYAFAVIPREHFSPSGTSNDYFYPNFIPRSIWSYGDVGVDYCLAVDTQSNCNSDYSNAYQWHELAFRTGSSSTIKTSRFGGSDNNVPEGMSLWYQHIDQKCV